MDTMLLMEQYRPEPIFQQLYWPAAAVVTSVPKISAVTIWTWL